MRERGGAKREGGGGDQILETRICFRKRGTGEGNIEGVATHLEGKFREAKRIREQWSGGAFEKNWVGVNVRTT